MKRLNTMSLAVITALGLGMGFSGCGSASSSVSSAPSFFTALVSRGDVYGASVKDSSSPANIAVEVEGTNKYTFKVKEADLTFPIIVNGGYVDVDGDGEITADVDMKLNIEMKSYTDTVTPVTTYLADEADKLKREAKLDDLVALVKDLTDVDDVTSEDLLKIASDTSADAQVVINALYAEMVKAGNVDLDLDVSNVKADFETRLKELDDLKLDTTTAEKQAAEIETYLVKELDIDTLTQVEVDKYKNSLTDALASFTDISEIGDLLGKTIYTIDIDADPITYSEFTLPATLDDRLVEIEGKTFELVSGAWAEVETTVKASIDGDKLTKAVTDSSDEVKTEVIELASSLNGSLTMSVSMTMDSDSAYTMPTLSTQAFHAEMTAEMKNPELLD